MMTTGEMNLRGLCTWNILLTPLVMSLGFYIEIFQKCRKQDASCRAVIATTWPREIAYMYVT